jgi:hypothetical protein
MPNAAPWGIVERVCNFAVRGPLGQRLLLPECVGSTDSEGRWLTWRKFPDSNGNLFQYPWNSTTTYDDFPVKCPNNKNCVANIADCTVLDRVDPLCNGNGACMADGSCLCNAGYMTWAYTAAFTAQIAYPYNINNPMQWSLNWNWLNYYDRWCTARDCSSPLQDCSFYGCFPGTLENTFSDALTACSGPAAGMCGATTQACLSQQNLVAPLACSGNGIPRQRQFRSPPEFYCVCGASLSPLDPSALYLVDETKLVPNGWSGPRCNIYYCPSVPSASTPNKLAFNITQSNGRPFVNRKNQTLPGIWT